MCLSASNITYIKAGVEKFVDTKEHVQKVLMYDVASSVAASEFVL